MQNESTTEELKIKQQIAEQVLQGDQYAGARLIRYLEESDPQGIANLRIIYPHTGRAYILGITGSPGTGKSTLVDQIITDLRSRDMKVGVIAIDPSSPFSGGAILGDRIRMTRHADDNGVFIRSMATRGHSGGLSRAAYAVTLVLDAMGYDVIIIETVGVGQDEVDVIDLAHTTAVVNVPGLGDDIQAIKAGVLEIGDVFIINKADRPGAEEITYQLLAMLAMRTERPGSWQPPVIKTVAPANQGIGELVDICFTHRDWLMKSGHLQERLANREIRFFRELIRDQVYKKIFERMELEEYYQVLVRDLRARKIDPYSAAEEFVNKLT